MRNKNDDYKPTIRVYCKGCKAWINEAETIFLDISEDIQGADILAFECNQCGTKNTSRRIG